MLPWIPHVRTCYTHPRPRPHTLILHIHLHMYSTVFACFWEIAPAENTGIDARGTLLSSVLFFFFCGFRVCLCLFGPAQFVWRFVSPRPKSPTKHPHTRRAQTPPTTRSCG
ncbi:hypothetical protein EDC01DRAFT_673157 [Geopyxis carbonaria]|nr:hypothetical protein EDC01DRAFT_673157 [Geopyxis carbonaria]